MKITKDQIKNILITEKFNDMIELDDYLISNHLIVNSEIYSLFLKYYFNNNKSHISTSKYFYKYYILYLLNYSVLYHSRL